MESMYDDIVVIRLFLPSTSWIDAGASARLGDWRSFWEIIQSHETEGDRLHGKAAFAFTTLLDWLWDVRGVYWDVEPALEFCDLYIEHILAHNKINILLAHTDGSADRMFRSMDILHISEQDVIEIGSSCGFIGLEKEFLGAWQFLEGLRPDALAIGDIAVVLVSTS